MAMEAQRLVTVSLTKIAASRQQRGGASLHRNLLVASVLYKARAMLLMENYRSQSCKAPLYVSAPVSSDDDDAVVPDDVDCVDGEDDVPNVLQDSTFTSTAPENSDKSSKPTAVLNVESETTKVSTSRMKKFENSLYAHESLACDEELSDEEVDEQPLNNSAQVTIPTVQRVHKRRCSEVSVMEDGPSECKKLRTEVELSSEHVPMSNLVNCFNSSFVGLLQTQQQQDRESGDNLDLNCAKVNSFEQHLSVPIILMV